MNQEIVLSIKLNTIMEVDKKTGSFIAYYEEFPQATAWGKTEEEAQDRLANICQIMFDERKEDLKKEIVDKYVNPSHLKNINLDLNTVNA